MKSLHGTYVKLIWSVCSYCHCLQKRITSDDKVTAMPLSLGIGWNHVQFHLEEFLQRWYGTGYVEAVGIEVHATCRVRRIYFTDASQREDELADEFRLAVISKSSKNCM